MAEITGGLRAILNHPLVYRFFQNLVGAPRLRRVLTRDYICPSSGLRVLDVGCGPADLLELLGPVEYVGFDLNPDYIESARRRFGERGRFYCERFDAETRVKEAEFDRVLAVGFLHHLDDEPAGHLFATARSVLRPGGRLITVDPCFTEDQSPIARWIIRRDRGQNVRTAPAYEALAAPHFGQVRAQARHNLLNIPYTHCILSCEA